MFDHATALPGAFWALAVAATFLFGMSKAGFGGAAGSLGVPLMALAVWRFASAAAEGREKDEPCPPMGDAGVGAERLIAPRL